MGKAICILDPSYVKNRSHFGSSKFKFAWSLRGSPSLPFLFLQDQVQQLMSVQSKTADAHEESCEEEHPEGVGRNLDDRFLR